MSDSVTLTHSLASKRIELFELAMQKKGIHSIPVEAISRSPHTTPCSLSFAQERIWFLHQLNPQNPAYNIPVGVRVSGVLNYDALDRALSELINRHEILRTSFIARDGQPLQVISKSNGAAFRRIDFSAQTEQERELKRLAEKEALATFDLERGETFRAKLVKLGEQEHVALFTLHHIISDGWSMQVLVKEIVSLYRAFLSGNGPLLPELPIQYADFALWQKQRLQGQVLEAELEYWKTQLSGCPVLRLPTDGSRPSVQTLRGATESFTIEPELAKELKGLCHQEGVTLFMLMLAAFKVLLYRYGGQHDIAVGIPIANRNRREIEPLIGFFVNTLVIRTDLGGEPSFRETLRRVREVALGAYAHQELPFEKLVEELQPERSTAYTPLFQVMFVLQNGTQEELELPGLRLSSYGTSTKTSKFDLTLSITDTGEGLDAVIEYSTDLFERETIKRMGEHYGELLRSIAKDAEEEITRLSIMTGAEREQVIRGWNETRRGYETGGCVQEMFEEQVKRSSGQVAVVCGEDEISYEELNRRANQLGRYLQKKGAGPEKAVGICMERGVEMVVALMGVLKSGAAYVPIDPEYPAKRIAAMVEDSHSGILLTKQRFLKRLPGQEVELICLDRDWDEIGRCSEEALTSTVTARNLAYIIYTSGSSGRPKGVMVEHRSLVNLTETVIAKYALTPEDRVLQFASISFDVAAEEIYPCLAVGATLILRTDLMLNSVKTFLGSCRDLRITVANVPTAYWHEITWEVSNQDIEFPDCVRTVIIGGEKALPERLSAWRDRVPQSVQLIHAYGPTETTITATICDLTGIDRKNGAPIGRPVANSQTYILQQNLEPVPIGVTGELYISGDCLSRGYVNLPEITAERFTPNAFGHQSGGRLYATGDLARYLADGNILFVGRIDDQVKVSGFRIEPGEIEAVLAQHPAIRYSAVTVKEYEEGRKQLVAFVVSDDEPAIESLELREYLAERLPDYMVPGTFVRLDALPLTTSGKIDRRALATLVQAGLEHQEAVTTPRTMIEEVMATIWATLLGVDQVGIHENFFELGGHSLLATQMTSRVREAFHVELQLQKILASPTISELAQAVEEELRGGPQIPLPPIAAVPRDGAIPLSYAQQRLWFLQQLHQSNPSYNVPSGARLTGALNASALERALNEVIRRHEILRTSFGVKDGKPVQVISPHRPMALPVIDLSGLSEDDRDLAAQTILDKDAHEPFELSEAPLLRAKLLRIDEGEHIMLLIMHHIICDAWSAVLLTRELQRLYEAYNTDCESPLADLEIQYADYAQWQREWLKGEILEAQLQYWKEQLSAVPAVLELPTDHPRPAVQSFRGDRYSFALAPELLAELKQLSRREGATLFMLMLAAFKVLLYRYGGQHDIAVGIPIANRNRREIEPLIGFFVNTLVIRTDLGGEPSFRETLRRVREVALGAYAHQELPFEKLVEELQPERSTAYTPLFQVMFVLQNGTQEELELPGLRLSSYGTSTKTSKFDLTLSITDTGEGLDAVIEYSTDLFERETIKRMGEHYGELLRSIAKDAEEEITRLSIMTGAEREQVIRGWNETRRGYETGGCVQEMFEEQVKRSSGQVAVVCGEDEISYEELNRRANQLGRYLQKKGAGPEKAVGICMERGVEMVVALMGVLKSGAAYVPIDPEYPAKRIRWMIEETGSAIVVTEGREEGKVAEGVGTIVRMDVDRAVIEKESGEDFASKAEGDNPAYIIHTSGSTGKPKGIMLSHRSLGNLIRWHNERLKKGARTLQFASMCFDASFHEIFASLTSGGSVYVIREEMRKNPVEVGRYIQQEEIEKVILPVVVLQRIAEEYNRIGEVSKSRKEVITTGEQLHITRAIKDMFRRMKGWELENHYGPSETHVVSSYRMSKEVEEWETHPPIGRAISNTQLYVLDKNLEAVPVGVVGEVYIGGVMLARGYAGRADLTAEKFIPDAVGEEGGKRLYKTGDRGRYRADGEIEFLGRKDNQVKIRGFRVELDEVESELSEHRGVRQNVVTVREDGRGEKVLAAYYVEEEEEEVSGSELRKHLKERLPEYMVPSWYVKLEAMPLTDNGKVDYKRLPDPESEREEAQALAPRTPLEEVMAGIWSEVLGLEQIGVNENFFELGGHSLLATQIVSRIREAFEVEIALQSMFDGPTISELTDVIEMEIRSERDHTDYWTSQLINLPTPDNAVRAGLLNAANIESASRYFPIPNDVTEELRILSRSERVSLSMTMLAAFQMLLYRHSGLEDIVVACPALNRKESANRLSVPVDDLLIMRADLSGHPTFLEFLEQVRRVVSQAYAFGGTGADALAEDIRDEITDQQTSLIRTVFIFERAPLDQLERIDLDLASQNLSAQAPELILYLSDGEEELAGALRYNADIHDSAAIDQIVTDFVYLLERTARSPEKRVSELASWMN